MNKLEGIVIEKLFFFSCYLTSIQDNISLTNLCMNLHKAKKLLFIRALLLSLYLQLVILYEEKGNSVLIFYEEKSQVTMNTEFMTAIKLLSNNRTFFFWIRSIKTSLVSSQEIYLSGQEVALPNLCLEEAIRSLEKCIYVFMKSMSELSLKYLYFDKTFNLLKIYFKFVCRDDFYRSISTLGKIPYTADFLKNLLLFMNQV